VTAEERDELIFLYAAGALEGDERDEVESWLRAGDGTAAAQLAAAEAELAPLARALAPIAPSAAVSRRLLQRIGEGASGGLAPLPRQRSHWLRPALAAGLAALLAGAIGGAIGAERAGRHAEARIAEIRGQVESALRDLSALHAELDRSNADRAALDDELANEEASRRALESDLVMARKAIGVLASEQSESMTLAGTGESAARGRVVWDWKNWYCFLHVTGLAPDPGAIYALWLFSDDGEVTGLGPFEADAQGEATLVAPVPHGLSHVVRAGVSIEPDRDLTSHPRGDVVLLGKSSAKRS
jgi:anti-sigma-K factor RskA